MAHFAKLSEENLVLSVEVVADADTTNESNVEDEATGVAFLQGIHGWTLWKKCSYNTANGKYYNEDKTEAEDQSKAFRKNYPSVGWSYDSTIDGFIPPKPEGMTSWIINTTTGHWEAPVAYPTIDTYNDGNKDRPYTISWDEPNVRWVATDKADPVGNWRWDVTSLAWVSI